MEQFGIYSEQQTNPLHGKTTLKTKIGRPRLLEDIQNSVDALRREEPKSTPAVILELKLLWAARRVEEVRKRGEEHL